MGLWARAGDGDVSGKTVCPVRIVVSLHALALQQPAFNEIRLTGKPWRKDLLSTEQLIPALAFTTLGVAIIYAIVHFFWTSKRRGDRQQTPLTQASERKRANEGSIIRK